MMDFSVRYVYFSVLMYRFRSRRGHQYVGTLSPINARNDSCVVKIVGYRGNRVVSSIPNLVTCGRFSWDAPTVSYHLPVPAIVNLSAWTQGTFSTESRTWNLSDLIW
jgi:hypothetical protein